MGFRVTSETIEILMNARGPQAVAPLTGYRSALQNPDVSRLQLAALLRRGSRSAGRRKRQNLWSAFTDQHLGRHANSNS